ncbi:hypothetical protein BC628DRAFT_1422785 [Trametes gibbosa]|nr:hypothetical protein BC628DRAFT_1422785 [Trametes gibbosa]
MHEPYRLPIELCELIIDSIRSWSTRYRVIQNENRDLASCALVCRDWRIRAQKTLWSTVFIGRRERISTLATALPDTPAHIISLISSVYVNLSDDRVPHVFFDLPLPSLRVLTMDSVAWTGHPIVLRNRLGLPFFETITELRLQGCKFNSVRGLFNIIWRCQGLQKLGVLKSMFNREQYGAMELELHNQQREHRSSCSQLLSLHLSGHPFDSEYPPLGPISGPKVTAVHLEYDDLACVADLLRLHLALPSLHSLTISGTLVNATYFVSNSGTALIPALIRFLSRLAPTPAATNASPALRLTLRVKNSEEAEERTLDALCGLDPIRGSVPGLARLEVHMGYLPPDRLGWWSDQIATRLPGTRDVLHVSCRSCEE